MLHYLCQTYILLVNAFLFHTTNRDSKIFFENTEALLDVITRSMIKDNFENTTLDLMRH